MRIGVVGERVTLSNFLVPFLRTVISLLLGILTVKIVKMKNIHVAKTMYGKY